MPRLLNLAPGSDDWLRWRERGLGATSARVVMGVDPWKLPRELWEELTGRKKPPESTFAMRRGQRLEPKARSLYERKTGEVCPPCCVEHDRWPWIRASLDGLTFLGDVVLEVKCPALERHREALAGKVPDYYLPQLQHQLLVTGAQRADYVSYSEHSETGEDERLAVVQVLPDPAYQKWLLAQLFWFWGRVVADWWPEDAKGVGV